MQKTVKMFKFLTLSFTVTIVQSHYMNMLNSLNRSMAEGLLQFVREGTELFNHEPQDTTNLLPEYDFIIVGAGSAGCVVANKLSEIHDWNILLIEAGRPENYVMDVPLLAVLFLFSEANWMYKNEPSDYVCLGMDKKQCVYAKGKVVGGSSVINFMIATRGNRRSYDNWENLGNPGWSYKDVLPYFLDIEDMTIPELSNDKEYHSTGGKVPISYAPHRTVLGEAFVAAGKEMGYREVDYNGKYQTGFGYVQSTTKNGTRWSSSRSFLHPIRKRKNFNLKKRSQVTKILIDPNNERAYGVEFIQNNRKYRVRAKKEVIISAGAINSPQLLMLSGIGPKQHLEDLGIPVLQDLKVGYNLMDHPAVLGVTFLVNQSVALVIDEMIDDGVSLPEYLNYHKGPFSIPSGCEGIAFFDTQHPNDVDGNPDLELLFLGGSVVTDRTFYKALNIDEHVNDVYFKPIINKHTWIAAPITLEPRSRGRVLIRSTNPLEKPYIIQNFYEDPYDLEIQLIGVKKSIELSKTKAFQKYGSRLHDIPVPGCEHLIFGSDDYWRCAIRHLSITLWHASGTCKMGPSTDPGAVVDERLKVYGVKGLRVIDASIMPVIPSAHINIPTMMIGAKGADIIKEDWGIYNLHG